MNKLILGDCLDIMKRATPNSIDAIITDPPYGLEFMGKDWDKGVPCVHFWQEMIRVLKPGGHLLAFSGTRTYHRMAVAIEDAGFEVRDMIEWCYGSGFPKSLNIGKAVARLQGEDIPKTKGFNVAGQGIGLNPNKELRSDHPNYVKPTYDNEWEGWGTALKPAHEPICMARKPLAEKTVAENVLKWGTGGINIDESRVETTEDLTINGNRNNVKSHRGNSEGESKVEANPLGRFPANLIHDNSEEVRECFPDSKSSNAIRHNKKDNFKFFSEGEKKPAVTSFGFSDEGNASRFFKSIIYQAKASKSERNKGCEGLEEKDASKMSGGEETRLDRPTNHPMRTNHHPTVKPIALMEYLIKMVIPKNGTVLDPFMGSGSTGVACIKNNYNFIGIELEPEYFEIAKARIDGWRER